MCRWAADLGQRVFLEDIITAPHHSLIAHTHHALEAKSPHGAIVTRGGSRQQSEPESIHRYG
jgi:hypothetical protein